MTLMDDVRVISQSLQALYDHLQSELGADGNAKEAT